MFLKEIILRGGFETNKEACQYFASNVKFWLLKIKRE